MGLLLSIPASASRAVVPISAIRFGLLITEHGPNVADAVVLVEGGKIKGVGHGDAAVPKGAKVIDLRPLGAVTLRPNVTSLSVVRKRTRTTQLPCLCPRRTRKPKPGRTPSHNTARAAAIECRRRATFPSRENGCSLSRETELNIGRTRSVVPKQASPRATS